MTTNQSQTPETDALLLKWYYSETATEQVLCKEEFVFFTRALEVQLYKLNEERTSLLAQIAVKDEALKSAELFARNDINQQHLAQSIRESITNSPAAAQELIKELHELRNFKAGALKSMATHSKPTTDW